MPRRSERSQPRKDYYEGEQPSPDVSAYEPTSSEAETEDESLDASIETQPNDKSDMSVDAASSDIVSDMNGLSLSGNNGSTPPVSDSRVLSRAVATDKKKKQHAAIREAVAEWERKHKERTDLAHKGRLMRRLDAARLESVEAGGEGDCQFLAVIDALHKLPVRREGSLTVKDMRESAATWLLKRTTDVLHYRPCPPERDPYQEFQRYCESLRREREVWGDELTLRALAEIFSVRILVYHDGALDSSELKDGIHVIEPRSLPESKSKEEISIALIGEVHYTSARTQRKPLDQPSARALADARGILEPSLGSILDEKGVVNPAKGAVLEEIARDIAVARTSLGTSLEKHTGHIGAVASPPTVELGPKTASASKSAGRNRRNRRGGRKRRKRRNGSKNGQSMNGVSRKIQFNGSPLSTNGVSSSASPQRWREKDRKTPASKPSTSITAARNGDRQWALRDAIAERASDSDYTSEEEDARLDVADERSLELAVRTAAAERVQDLFAVDDDEFDEDAVDEESYPLLSQQHIARYEASQLLSRFRAVAVEEEEADEDEDAEEKDDVDAREATGASPYKIYFPVRKNASSVRALREKSVQFAPQATPDDASRDYLRSLVFAESAVAERAQVSLARLMCNNSYTGVGAEANFVTAAGGRHAMLNFMIDQCPMWAPWIFTDEQHRSAILGALVDDEAVCWSHDGRPLTPEEETSLTQLENTIRVAHDVVQDGAGETASSTKNKKKKLSKKELFAIKTRLIDTCSNDFLVPGTCYVIAYTADGVNGTYVYVGESVNVGTRLGSHLAGVEGYWKKKGKKQYAHERLHPQANADIAVHNNTLSTSAVDTAPSESVAKKIRRARRTTLVKKRHFVACTSGVFVKSAQREIISAYVRHCRNVKMKNPSLKLPTVDDAVRFVGILKWVREIFDTLALKSLRAENARFGLNASPPGEPYRWLEQRHADSKPWSDKDDEALLSVIHAFEEKLKGSSMLLKAIYRRNLSGCMSEYFWRGTGIRRSVVAMMTRFTFLYESAKCTLDSERTKFQKQVIEAYEDIICRRMIHADTRHVKAIAAFLDECPPNFRFLTNRTKNKKKLIPIKYKIMGWDEDGVESDVDVYTFLHSIRLPRQDGSTRLGDLQKAAEENAKLRGALEKVKACMKRMFELRLITMDTRRVKAIAAFLDECPPGFRFLTTNETKEVDGKKKLIPIRYKIMGWDEDGVESDVDVYRFLHSIRLPRQDGSTRLGDLQKAAEKDAKLRDALEKIEACMKQMFALGLRDLIETDTRRVKAIAAFLDECPPDFRLVATETKEIDGRRKTIHRTYKIMGWDEDGVESDVNVYTFLKSIRLPRQDGSTRLGDLQKAAEKDAKLRDALEKIEACMKQMFELRHLELIETDTRRVKAIAAFLDKCPPGFRFSAKEMKEVDGKKKNVAKKYKIMGWDEDGVETDVDVYCFLTNIQRPRQDGGTRIGDLWAAAENDTELTDALEKV